MKNILLIYLVFVFAGCSNSGIGRLYKEAGKTATAACSSISIPEKVPKAAAIVPVNESTEQQGTMPGSVYLLEWNEVMLTW